MQEDYRFEATLGYIERPGFKKKNKKKKNIFLKKSEIEKKNVCICL
jgi:hypothetical protein